MDKQEKFLQKVTLLKDARLKLLHLHKNLVDLARNNYERSYGKISSGKFLNLLISNEEFSWLRKFSILIVEIDEMFDLDDGYEEKHLDTNIKKIRELLSLNSEDQDFNTKFTKVLEKNQQIKEKQDTLIKLLNK